MKAFPALFFLLIFSLVYYGMNYYVLGRGFGFFGLSFRVWLWALVLTLSFPLVMFVDRFAHSLPTRILYFASGSWLGIVFLCFVIFLLAELINLVVPIFQYSFVGKGLVLFAGLLSIFSLINGSVMTTKEVVIDDFGAEQSVVQLSDVHVGTIRNQGFLRMVVSKVNALKPDMVVITGDLVDGSGKLEKETFAPLQNLEMPAYFVMGNHEVYEDTEKVKSLLADTPLIVLENEMVETDGISLIGLSYTENKKSVRKTLEQLSLQPSQPSILLNHAPIGYEAAKQAGVRLQLSGHTHQGQLFPFTLLVSIPFPRIGGLYTEEGFSLYVSPGTGTWGPPMRLGSRNEITLFRLR